jgi:hypothetical protein
MSLRVIAVNQAPDHAMIRALPRAPRGRDRRGVWRGLGTVRARSGLAGSGSRGRRHEDRAAATHRATRSYEQIAQEILEDAARIDAAEDELFGDARGDELPEGLRTSGDRRKVLREAEQALDAARAAQAKKIPRDRSERLVECRRRLRQDWQLERHVVGEHAAWHAAGIASDGSRRTVGARHNIKPCPLTPEPGGQDQRERSRLAQPQDHARLVQRYNARPSSARARWCSPPRSAPSR